MGGGQRCKHCSWNHRPQSHPGQQAITTLYKQDSSTILISTILYTYFYHLKKIWWHLLHFTIGDWVSHLLFSDNKERPQRPVTFDKFDHIDEETWPDQHFEFFTIFDNFFQCWQFWHFLFKSFWQFWQLLNFFDNFDNCWQFF